MQTFAIIPDFNVFKDGRASLGARSELYNSTVELESAKEAFHNSVVVTIADAAHTDLTLERRQTVLIGDAGKLAALVGMMEQARSRVMASNRHVKHLQQRGMQMVSHRPADNFTRVQVENRGQVQPALESVS